MSHNSGRKNIFKKKKNTNLKTNGRWKNFQKTVETEREKTNTFQKKSRFDNFDSSNKNERSSRFGKKQHSKFGKKRIYKSRYKKEETMDYFKTKKNATQRNVSLFDFAKKKTIEKKEEKPKLKIVDEKKYQKDEITQAEKDFILNQYMYEEETEDEEEEQTNITLNITEKQNNDIIDF